MNGKNKLLWIDKDPTLYSTNYIGMFDLTKGITMVEIILLHCINDYLNLLMFDGGDSIVLKLLCSPLLILRYGAVPMLFMICGYGIRRQSIRRNISANLKVFLFPYACVILGVTICVIMKWLLAGGSLGTRLIYQVFPFLIGFHPGSHLLNGKMDQIGPVWFFATYILADIYLNLVLQEKRTWVQILILAVGTACGLILVGLRLPFCLQQMVICAGFMYVGMWLKKAKIPQQKLPVVPIVLVYLLCTVLTGLGGLVEIGNNVYWFGGVELLTAYLAGIILLCLYQRLNVLQGRMMDGLRWIGRHMMWFCCIHTVSYLVVPWDRIAAFFSDRLWAGLILEIGFSFAYAIITCILLDLGVKKFLSFKRKKKEEG